MVLRKQGMVVLKFKVACCVRVELAGYNGKKSGLVNVHDKLRMVNKRSMAANDCKGS